VAFTGSPSKYDAISAALKVARRGALHRSSQALTLKLWLRRLK
jgi:hypothetical protein